MRARKLSPCGIQRMVLCLGQFCFWTKSVGAHLQQCRREPSAKVGQPNVPQASVWLMEVSSRSPPSLCVRTRVSIQVHCVTETQGFNLLVRLKPQDTRHVSSLPGCLQPYSANQGVTWPHGVTLPFLRMTLRHS